MDSRAFARGIDGPGASRQTLISDIVNAYHQKAFAEFLREKDENGNLVHEDFRNRWMKARVDQHLLSGGD